MAPASSAEDHVMACLECGAAMAEGRRFCMNCGEFRQPPPPIPVAATLAVAPGGLQANRALATARAHDPGGFVHRAVAGWINRSFTALVTTGLVALFIHFSGRGFDPRSVAGVGRDLWFPTVVARWGISELFDGMIPILTPGQVIVAKIEGRFEAPWAQTAAALGVAVAVAAAFCVVPFGLMVFLYDDIHRIAEWAADAGFLYELATGD